MKKYLQNRVAGSRLTLPVTVVIAVVVWLLAGLATSNWWIQFFCFGLSAYLMVELNNIHALIRIYSRMVSCMFLLLGCCACFMFPSIRGAVLQLCLIGALTILFTTYQDKQAPGKTYYAFVLMGLASMAHIQMVWYMPLLWLLMTIYLQSLSWRTWGASLLGLLTPYWFSTLWIAWKEDYTPMVDHLAQLGDLSSTVGFSALTMNQIAVFAFVMLLTITGTVHHFHKRHEDKMRIRMIYGFFIWLDLVTAVFIVLQPQHYDWLMRIMMVTTAPLIAHYISLTGTRFTNIYSCVLAAITLLLTVYNLWTSSFLF